MAKIEQLVCRLGRDVPQPAILGRTSGLTRELANEALQIGAQWKPLLHDEGQRPALLARPLRNMLPGTPGRLFLAMRVAPESAEAALCHGLFLAEADFAAARYNPYRLEKEGLFLDRWSAGLALDSRERTPDGAPPLVLPPPGPQDAEIVDEALRLYFSTARLVLPLARPEAASDRFLALFLECLPPQVKKQLSFASFAASGQSDFGAGAVFMADGGFRAWQNSLLATVRQPLPPHYEQYVGEVRRCLAAGDLASLALATRLLDAGPAAAPPAPRPSPAPRVAATITREAAPVPEMPIWQRAPFRVPAGAGPSARGAAGAARGRSASANRVGRRGGARLALGAGALVLGVVLLLVLLPRRPDGPAGRAGAGADASPAPGSLARAGRPPRDGGAAAGERSPESAAAPGPAADRPAAGGLGGVVEIGTLYASELAEIKGGGDPAGKGRAGSVPGAAGSASGEGPVGGAGGDAAPAAVADALAASHRALAALRERGGDSLLRQCREYVAAAGSGITEPARPDREARRAGELAPKGAALAREARRLALASYALTAGRPWEDLGYLDDRRLAARWDSLNRAAPREAAAVAEQLGMTGLIDRLDAVRAEAAARARLAALLAQPRRDAAWLTELERAAAVWDGRTEPVAEVAWRDLALALTRLKRAEDQAGFGGLAYARDYGRGAWLPPAVREAAAALRADLARCGEAAAPPLVASTLAFHDGLARVQALAADRADADALAEGIASLAANPAVAFDADQYAAHVERTRLEALASLLARGRAADAAPAVLFPGDDRRGTVLFLSLAQSGASDEAWRSCAASAASPFLKRLAALRADDAMGERARAPDTFETDFQRLAGLAADLCARAQRGQDWSAAYAGLQRELAVFRERHRVAPTTPAERREKLARVEALAAAAAKPLPVPLEAVTVRLAPDQLRSPAEVVVELTADGGDALAISPAILLQAEGDGAWTGSKQLGVELALRPGQPLTAVVRRVADARVLVTARYGADPAAMAPGALGRAMPDGAGSTPGTVAFTTPGWFWRRLRLPDLRQPLATAGMDGASALP